MADEVKTDPVMSAEFQKLMDAVLGIGKKIEDVTKEVDAMKAAPVERTPGTAEIIESKRAPAFNECLPIAKEVLLVNSQSRVVLCDWPTCEPPPVNASLTSIVGIELSAFCAVC